MLLVALALAPVAFLITYFYLRDRYEREPRFMIIRVFIAGALSTIPAFFLSVAVSAAIGIPESGATLAQALAENFIAVGLVEEGCKFFAFYWWAYRSPELNEPYDAMLYSILAALGFAAVENVLYVVDGGVGVGLIRALLSVPAHALFGAVIGYYMGRAKFCQDKAQAGAWGVYALFLATILHGTYDYVLGSGSWRVVLLVVPLSVIMWTFVLHQVRRAQAGSPFANSELRHVAATPEQKDNLSDSF
jgi:RsiW-degrading membrane proteinase PrsW (M82 family)